LAGLCWILSRRLRSLGITGSDREVRGCAASSSEAASRV